MSLFLNVIFFGEFVSGETPAASVLTHTVEVNFVALELGDNDCILVVGEYGGDD